MAEKFPKGREKMLTDDNKSPKGKIIHHRRGRGCFETCCGGLYLKHDLSTLFRWQGQGGWSECPLVPLESAPGKKLVEA